MVLVNVAFRLLRHRHHRRCRHQCQSFLSFVQTVAGILNLVASIWESILPDLAKSINEPSLDLIEQTVTGKS